MALVNAARADATSVADAESDVAAAKLATAESVSVPEDVSETFPKRVREAALESVALAVSATAAGTRFCIATVSLAPI
jgi:hypothetical protein